MMTMTQGLMTATRLCVRPRPVFCVVADAYRDRAVAEAVCAGRFTHAGVTLALGTEPDWLTAPFPPDAEWRIEWSKFYYGLDLAHAYSVTGDERFPRAWERLVRSWIRQVPVGFDSSDVTARRVQNWIYAWDSFVNAARFDDFTEGFEEELLASLAAQIEHLRAHLTPERNHRTLELYALFVTALALPELDKDGALRDLAITELHHNLLTDIRPDGIHREHSTHYHMLVLRSFLGAKENARRFGLTLPAGFDQRLQAACDFALHCHRPDGSIPALSDSDTASYNDLLALAADIFNRPDYLYAATGGAQGVAPAQRNVSFPDGGYFIQRSDWGTNHTAMCEARYLIFDCGALGDGGHGHYDLLNVEIAAMGRPLVVDPGRYTYSEHGANWRRWFKRTAAHNTVCVDGLDQTPYRCGKSKGATARGHLIERLSAPGLDVLCGEAVSSAYDARHTRRIFFIAGEYWLIFDHLRGASPHRFDLRFHLTTEAWQHTSVETHETNGVVRAPGLALVFAAREARIEQGWVAPQYGTKFPAPVVSVVEEAATEARFYTLVMPLDADAPAPKLLVHAEQLGGARTARVEIAGVGTDCAATDILTWSMDGHCTLTRSAGGCVVSAARSSPNLARDPRLPQRDLLLDAGAVAERLAARLGSTGPVRVSACERLRAKYRSGHSLRVLHRIRIEGRDHIIAARAFADGASGRAYERALGTPTVHAPLRPVVHDADIDTVFWTFPNDRRIEGLRVLQDVPPELARAVAPSWTHSRLVAYAPEKCATAQCLDDERRVLAYAKVYAGEDGQRAREVYRVLAGHAGADAARVEFPRVLAYAAEHRLLMLAPAAGLRVADLRGADRLRGYRRLGRALAALHNLSPPRFLPPFRRLDIDRIQHAAQIISSVRPDAQRAACALADELARRHEASDAPRVFLHGDVHAKNGILQDDRLTLIDLDQAATGPAAAELGSLLAGLSYNALVGLCSHKDARDLGNAFLLGYASVRALPATGALRWHTAAALLAERALRAVNRVRPEGLARLPELLREAHAVLHQGGAR